MHVIMVMGIFDFLLFIQAACGAHMLLMAAFPLPAVFMLPVSERCWALIPDRMMPYGCR